MTVIEHDEVGLGFCPDLEKDLTVGVVVPHVIVASQDVAYDQSSLAQHGVTHILNVAVGLPNAFPAVSDLSHCIVFLHFSNRTINILILVCMMMSLKIL